MRLPCVRLDLFRQINYDISSVGRGREETMAVAIGSPVPKGLSLLRMEMRET